MIAIGADKPPETWPESEQHRAQIARYVRRVGDEMESSFKPVYAGTITTTTLSASTTQAVSGAAADDVVLLFPADSTAAAMAGVYATVADIGGGTIGISMTHPNQAPTGVFHALVVAL
jgi:Ethanolamine utilization protein EutJ (predicted chaperonin)